MYIYIYRYIYIYVYIYALFGLNEHDVYAAY